MKTFDIKLMAAVHVRVKLRAKTPREAEAKAIASAQDTYDSIHRRTKRVVRVGEVMVMESPLLLKDYSHAEQTKQDLIRIAKRIAARESGQTTDQERLRRAHGQ